jgi:hypothetical protein
LTKNKKHIDSIFKNGLKNLRFLVSQKDLEAIEQKTNQFENTEVEISNKLPIEIEINESDWLKTQEKLAHEKKSINFKNKLADSFQDFEIPVSQNDWSAVQSKLNKSKKRKPILWFYSIAISILLISMSWGGYQWLKHDNSNSISKLYSNSISNSNNNELGPKNLSDNPNKLSDNNITNNESSQQEIKTELSLSPINSAAELPQTKNIKSPIKNPISTVQKPETSSSQTPNNNNEYKVSQTLDLDFIHSLRIANIHNPFYKPTPSLDLEFIPAITPKNPVIKKPKTNIYIGLENGISSFYSALNTNNPSGYNMTRKQSDEKTFAYTKGLSFGISSLKKQLQLSAQHAYFKQTSNYNLTYKIYDSIPVKDPNGKIIGYFLARGRDTSINETHQISRNLFNIHLSASEKWKINNKTKLITGVGVAAQLHSLTKGSKILNPESLRLETLQVSNLSNRRLLLMPSFTIGIQHQLYKNISIQADISSQYSVNNLFKNNLTKEYPYQVTSSFKLLYIIK